MQRLLLFALLLSFPPGDCLILLVETVRCRCLRILPFTLPTCSHTRGITALFQLRAAATAATPEQIFCSFTRVVAQRGKIPLRFPETRHAAPAAGSSPVPKGGQEGALFRLIWCFVKLPKMGLRGTCSAPLVCPLAPRQDKLYLNLF